MNTAQSNMTKQEQLKSTSEDYSQMLFSTIVDCSVITMDLQGNILSWNAGAQLLSGYSAGEVIGSHISSLYAHKEQDTGEAMQDLESARTKGRFEHISWRLRKDGTKFLANVVTSTLTDPAGTICAFGELSRDLTVQHLKEQSLREQLEIINLSHETIMILGLDGVIQFWNRGAEEMYGFSEAEAIGKKGHEILRTEFPRPLGDIQSMLLKDGRWDGELVHHSRSGEAVTVLSRWVVRNDASGNPSSFLEIDRGINERINAEQKRLQDKADRELRVKERITELAASEKLLLSKTLEIAKSDEEREIKIQERIVELAISEELLSGKMLEIAKSDEQRELRVQERIVELAASEQLLLSKVLEIEKSDEQRELRVQERIVELAASEELLRSKVMELERSNEELQQFAYVCSHDLQEPLRVISNYTQLLSKRYSGQLDAKADLFISFAVDASKRMQILINDLLAYSRLQTREKKIGPVDCNTVLKMALANLEILLTETGAQVNYGSLPVVVGDQSQLLQLFQNLIGNALKFRSKEPIIIDISVEREGDEWLWTIRDNGIGFDIQFQERIFLIFQRLHTKEEYSGSGIGLAVCKKIVLRHGGRIWAESEPGKGASFNFTLPAQSKEHQNG